MISGLRNLLRRDHGAPLAALQLGLAVLLSAGLAIAAVPGSEALRLARITGGEISGGAFERLTSGMDPAMLSLAGRFEPRLQPLALRPALEDGTLETAQILADAETGVIRLQDLSPDAARAWNAAQPIATLPNPAAKPFHLATEGVLDEARAVDCMTAAIYYEAAYESTDGQRAVAQVVLNRMRHPAFPKSVCGVVFQGSNRTTGCQFTFTCDGSLARKPSDEGWARARKVAEAALNGYVMKGVGNATHYHAAYVAPYWSPSLVKVSTIGAHIFYRWTGGWGLPPAFGGRYAGGEMAGLQMATLDGLAKGPAKVTLAANIQAETSTEPQAPVIEEAAPEPAKAEPDLVVAADRTAQAASALVKAEDLDWAGRPKEKRAPRIAAPSAASGFGGASPF